VSGFGFRFRLVASDPTDESVGDCRKRDPTDESVGDCRKRDPTDESVGDCRKRDPTDESVGDCRKRDPTDESVGDCRSLPTGGRLGVTRQGFNGGAPYLSRRDKMKIAQHLGAGIHGGVMLVMFVMLCAAGGGARVGGWSLTGFSWYRHEPGGQSSNSKDCGNVSDKPPLVARATAGTRPITFFTRLRNRACRVPVWFRPVLSLARLPGLVRLPSSPASGIGLVGCLSGFGRSGFGCPMSTLGQTATAARTV
jgi:hypothetical protein